MAHSLTAVSRRICRIILAIGLSAPLPFFTFSLILPSFSYLIKSLFSLSISRSIYWIWIISGSNSAFCTGSSALALSLITGSYLKFTLLSGICTLSSFGILTPIIIILPFSRSTDCIISLSKSLINLIRLSIVLFFLCSLSCILLAGSFYHRLLIILSSLSLYAVSSIYAIRHSYWILSASNHCIIYLHCCIGIAAGQSDLSHYLPPSARLHYLSF